MTDAEWNEAVRQQTIKLASLFAAISTEVHQNSMIGIMASKGGRLALELCTEASNRNIAARMEAEQAQGYDLAALASAGPPAVEE